MTFREMASRGIDLMICKELRCYPDRSTPVAPRHAVYPQECDDLADVIYAEYFRFHQDTTWEARRAVADTIYKHFQTLRAIY